ncbi:hypothetical protein ACLM5H_09395 [Fredinandcohnia humi]
MLKTIIQYPRDRDLHIQNVLLNIKDTIKLGETEYLLLFNNKELARISLSSLTREIFITFSGSFNLAQYERIHNVILFISKEVDGTIDDSESRLGYLENGEPAYIVNKWSQWTELLNTAKYKTLEGQMVRVMDQTCNELGTGMLVEYKFSTSLNQTSVITECTLITLLGERHYVGETLYIEPTGQW